VLWSLVPLVVTACAVLLALLVSRRYFLRGLVDQARHLALYRTFIKKGAYQRRALSHFLNIRELFRNRRSNVEFAGRVIWCEPIRTFLFFPEFLVGLLWLSSEAAPAAGGARLLAPVAVTLVIYLATTTEALNHLGQAHRYIDFNLYFALPVILGLLALDLPVPRVALPLIAYTVYVALFNAGHILALRTVLAGPSRDALSDFLAPLCLTSEHIVFPSDMRLAAEICARTPCKSFYWQPVHVTRGVLNEFIEEYPFFRKDMPSRFAVYGVTHVICRKSMLKEVPWEYDFDGLSLLAEEGDLVAYSVPHGGPGDGTENAGTQRR